ncbi:hypothetical protein GN330_14080 [Nitratireductor sp. CAU 1489]|uniref:Uncharacterized protein n=1 Tax=Nitratireductor arenosus TaxID=2682096 RepID=A0A844QK42_9HYPH|nr:hypothetical protein [Nitratireductor arenosus]MVA98373.1 hypothetical protein [Nitratireductor arenosus]
MGDGLLFGYTVEENDGTFVITLSGKLAVPILQDIGANMGRKNGRDSDVPALFPFSALASNAVHLTAQDAEGAAAGQTNLEEIFGQGFDRDFAEFDQQLDQYRQLLRHYGDAAAGAEAASPEDESKSKKSSQKT